MKISVFGNPDLSGDEAAIRSIPWLKQKYPGVEIKIEDPSEGLQPADDWVIVDVCPEVKKKTWFSDLNRFSAVRRVSVHDYDLVTELKLLKKLGKIKKLRILAMPVDL